MARRIEEQTTYGDTGIRDEWMPAHRDSHDLRSLRTDADYRRYVREWNKRAKAEGGMTRIRSVEVDDEY